RGRNHRRRCGRRKRGWRRRATGSRLPGWYRAKRVTDSGVHAAAHLELGQSRGETLTLYAGTGQCLGQIFERIEREVIERLHRVEVRANELGDFRFTKALRVAAEGGESMPQVAPNALGRRRVLRVPRFSDEATQMLALAHHLESKALGGRGRRVR